MIWGNADISIPPASHRRQHRSHTHTDTNNRAGADTHLSDINAQPSSREYQIHSDTISVAQTSAHNRYHTDISTQTLSHRHQHPYIIINMQTSACNQHCSDINTQSRSHIHQHTIFFIHSSNNIALAQTSVHGRCHKGIITQPPKDCSCHWSLFVFHIGRQNTGDVLHASSSLCLLW